MRPGVAPPAARIAGMLARELISLHKSPREVPPFSERYAGLTAEQGYQAARALHEHRIAHGWRPVGRKIGFTNRTLWSRYGVYEPMWGMVYDRTLIRANDNGARVSLDAPVNPRIKPEICFGLRAAPQGERLVDCIEWMAHSIEIVQCPIRTGSSPLPTAPRIMACIGAWWLARRYHLRKTWQHVYPRSRLSCTAAKSLSIAAWARTCLAARLPRSRTWRNSSPSNPTHRSSPRAKSSPPASSPTRMRSAPASAGVRALPACRFPV